MGSTIISAVFDFNHSAPSYELSGESQTACMLVLRRQALIAPALTKLL